MGWYITILQEMRDTLGLKGNELIVYAFIYGYSQGGQGCYFGSLADLQKVCGIASRQTAIDTLKKLMEKGLIQKTETWHNGVKYVTYACPKNIQAVQKMDTPCPENGHNNKEYENINRESIKRFVPPTIKEVQAFCQERQNGIDAEEFVAFYSSKGWMVGKSRMKDWKAAIVTWEKARKKAAKPVHNAAKPSKFEQSLINLDAMFNQNLHEVAYKKETCDEQ